MSVPSENRAKTTDILPPWSADAGQPNLMTYLLDSFELQNKQTFGMPSCLQKSKLSCPDGDFSTRFRPLKFH